MKTTNKNLVFLLVSLISLVLSSGPVNYAQGQSKSDFAASAEQLKDYYYGPVENDGYVYTMYNSQVDFATIDQEELGTAILGGFVVSYSKAGKKDNIGVIIVNTSNEAIAMTMEKSDLKKFAEGRMTVDELLARTEKYSFDLADIPTFNTSLFTDR